MTTETPAVATDTISWDQGIDWSVAASVAEDAGDLPAGADKQAMYDLLNAAAAAGERTAISVPADLAKRCKERKDHADQERTNAMVRRAVEPCLRELRADSSAYDALKPTDFSIEDGKVMLRRPDGSSEPLSAKGLARLVPASLREMKIGDDREWEYRALTRDVEEKRKRLSDAEATCVRHRSPPDMVVGVRQARKEVEAADAALSGYINKNRPKAPPPPVKRVDPRLARELQDAKAAQSAVAQRIADAGSFGRQPPQHLIVEHSLCVRRVQQLQREIAAT